MASYVACGVASFVCGAASTYFFHRPPLDRTSVKILGLGGLQGTAALTATVGLGVLCAITIGSLFPHNTKKENKQVLLFSWAVSYIVAAAAVFYSAKHLTTRLGTPMETLTNFVLSSVLGTIVFIKNN